MAATYKVPVQPNPHLIVENSQLQTPPLPNDGSWKKTLATVVPVATSTDSADDAATTTLTDAVSKELLSSYLAQTQNGGQVSSDFENNLVNKLVGDSTNVAMASNAKTYTVSDIKVSNDTSTAALHAYGNALGKAIQSNSPGTTTNELIIYANAAENNDPQSVSAMLPIIESYQKTLAVFLAMPVPKNATDMHLNLINSYSQIISTDETLMKFPSDPMASIYGLKEYETGSVAVYNSIEAYPVFFKSQNVTFSSNEPGFILSNLSTPSN